MRMLPVSSPPHLSNNWGSTSPRTDATKPIAASPIYSSIVVQDNQPLGCRKTDPGVYLLCARSGKPCVSGAETVSQLPRDSVQVWGHL